MIFKGYPPGAGYYLTERSDIKECKGSNPTIYQSTLFWCDFKGFQIIYYEVRYS